MKLISINEDLGRIGAVDRLVKDGVFTSRSEVYRAGALLMISLEGARKFSKIDKLNSELYGKKVASSLNLLDTGRIAELRNELSWVIDALRLRALLAPLLGDQTRDIYETTADTFVAYSEVLSNFDKEDKQTKQQIASDLKRDLSALQDSVKSTSSLVTTLAPFAIGYSVHEKKIDTPFPETITQLVVASEEFKRTSPEFRTKKPKSKNVEEKPFINLSRIFLGDWQELSSHAKEPLIVNSTE